MYKILFIVLATVVILNLVVSITVARRDDLNILQKTVQIIIAWLIPLFGAIGIWSLHKSYDEPIEPSKPIGSSGLDNYTVGGD